MSRLLGLFCCFLTVGASVCLTTSRVSAQPLPDRAALRGLIVDQDGKPLKGVFLSLRRQSTEGSFAFWGGETASDEGGNFRFENAEEGDYYLSAELDGYASVLSRAISWKRRGGVERVQLTRLANARLRFLTLDGQPLSQSHVWLKLQSASGETVVNAFRTDAQGALTVPNVVSGRYTLWAHSAQGYAVQKLELQPQTALPTIEVRLQNGGGVTIVARDGEGNGLGGGALALSPATADEAARLGSPSADLNEDYSFFAAEGDRAGIVTRDGDGRIELRHLPPGRYAARLALPGYLAFAPRLVDVQEGQNLPLEWDFATRRAGSLTLDLRTRDDKPVAGREVTVRVLPINTDGTLSRDPFEAGGQAAPFFPSGAGARRAVSDAKGRLRLFPLRPGRYRVFVAPHDPNASGAPAPESSPLDLDVGQSGATTDVVLP